MYADSSHMLLMFRLLSITVAVVVSLAGLASTPALAETAVGSTSAAAAVSDKDAESDFRGVDLGQYQVRTYYPLDAQKSVVSFTLYATVKDADVAEFERLFEYRRHKVRDQVIIATRLVPLADFNDPELAGFRRRLLLRLRRMLPELAIQDTYLSDFELTVEAL